MVTFIHTCIIYLQHTREILLLAQASAVPGGGKENTVDESLASS